MIESCLRCTILSPQSVQFLFLQALADRVRSTRAAERMGGRARLWHCWHDSRACCHCRSSLSGISQGDFCFPCSPNSISSPHLAINLWPLLLSLPKKCGISLRSNAAQNSCTNPPAIPDAPPSCPGSLSSGTGLNKRSSTSMRLL